MYLKMPSESESLLKLLIMIFSSFIILKSFKTSQGTPVLLVPQIKRGM